ncbi:MAG: hypothetical protein Q7T74_01230 [Candidatus Saccharibacteria bacterium]|nr:hypothetical protein [Candidatus Saccharibacteria bacterium]
MAMTEIEGGRIIPMQELSYANAYFDRAYCVYDALSEIFTARQKMELHVMDRFLISKIELADKNEVITITISPPDNSEASQPKVFKIPEWAHGSDYLRYKNQYSDRDEIQWVEAGHQSNPELHEFLNKLENIFNFGTAEVVELGQEPMDEDVEAAIIRQLAMQPHISKAIRSMVGLPRQKVVSAQVE